mgnify:FL=1
MLLADAAGTQLPTAVTGDQVRSEWEKHVPDFRTDEDTIRGLYRERAHLVAYLASLWPAKICDNDPNAPDRSVIYVKTPAGQMAWHIADDDLDLFTHVPRVDPDDPGAPAWDEQATHDRYARLARLAETETVEASCRLCGCTSDHPCEGGCHWVPNSLGADVCSVCVERLTEPDAEPQSETLRYERVTEDELTVEMTASRHLADEWMTSLRALLTRYRMVRFLSGPPDERYEIRIARLGADHCGREAG